MPLLAILWRSLPQVVYNFLGTDVPEEVSFLLNLPWGDHRRHLREIHFLCVWAKNWKWWWWEKTCQKRPETPECHRDNDTCRAYKKRSDAKARARYPRALDSMQISCYSSGQPRLCFRAQVKGDLPGHHLLLPHPGIPAPHALSQHHVLFHYGPYHNCGYRIVWLCD